MANKTIFELPEQTGKTDNDVLAIVNSGNTTTSKIKVSTLLSGVGGFIKGLSSNNTNIIPDYYATSATTSTTSYSFIGGGQLNRINTNSGYNWNTIVGGYNNLVSGASWYHSIFGGLNNTMAAGGADPKGGVIIGGQSNNCAGWSHIVASHTSDNNGYYYNLVLGGFNNDMSAQANRDASTIVGGLNNSITGGQRATLLGGSSNIINAGNQGGMLGGATNTLGSDNSVIAGGQFAQITGTSSYSFIAGGQSNRVYTSTHAASVCGNTNIVENSSDNSGTFVGSQNKINNSIRAFIIGGESNNVLSGSTSSGIFGGKDNTITAATTSVIVVGQTNTISGATHAAIVGGTNHSNRGNRSVIVGGSGNTITHERSVILGGSGLTSNEDAEVLVQNLKISGQTSGNHFDNASGTTFTIDWNKGNHQTISITGSTTLTFNNTKNGGTYKLQVINTTTGSTLTSITATGYTIKEDGGSISFTNNSTDLLICEVFGTIILVRHFTDFS